MFRNGIIQILVEIKFSQPLMLETDFWVEDDVEIKVKFRYENIFGRCSMCKPIIHTALLNTSSGV